MRASPLVYGIAVALFGAVALVGFGAAVAGTLLLLVGLGVVAANEWLRAEERRKARDMAQRYLALAAETAETPAARLRRELGRLRFEPRYGAEAVRALEQLSELERLYDRFLELLRQRLNPGEATFERYAASGRKVFELVVLSLAAVCERLPALEARTDRDRLGAAPTRTALVVGGEPAASRSEHGLAPAREFVDELFRRNAVAIDGFQRINAAIGATQAARAAGEFSASIRDLEELERQLRRYGR
jgi:hypothetical protein